jgi:hypothetical protein
MAGLSGRSGEAIARRERPIVNQPSNAGDVKVCQRQLAKAERYVGLPALSARGDLFAPPTLSECGHRASRVTWSPVSGLNGVHTALILRICLT